MHTTQASSVLTIAAILYVTPVSGQTIPALASSAHDTAIAEQARFETQFRKGDTNAPLLVMDWFSGPHVDQFCRVSQNGAVASARNVINWAIQGSHWAALDTANMFLLVQTINGLPLRSKPSLPQDRQIIVSGIRSNQWFQCIYDRADIPDEVERLYEITGAYLEWSIPEVKGQQIIQSEHVNDHPSQDVIASFSVASAAPIAISSGAAGIQIWDLNRETVKPLLFLKTLFGGVDFNNYLTVAAISPDGNTIAVASNYAIFAIDWKAEKILWKGDPLARLGEAPRLNQKIAIGGEKGRFLFVAGAGTIERLDLATGKILGVLATNQPTIKFLKTSRDGRILVAGFDDSTFMDTMSASLTVWNAGSDEPVAHVVEPGRSGVAISPDGRRIALSVFGQKGLKLWNWQDGTTAEVPLRTPYASSQAYEMHWSPDGTKFAAYVDTYPASIVIYNARNWKPLAHWKCGQVMSDAKFDFEKNGEFVELRDHDITGLDTTGLQALGE